MKIKGRVWCIALLVLVPLPAGSKADMTAKVEGVVLNHSVFFFGKSRVLEQTLTVCSRKRRQSHSTDARLNVLRV
jgi:hypothetical protein